MDEFDSKIRPMQLKGTIDFQNKVSELVYTLKSQSLQQMKSFKQDKNSHNVFISLEEIRDIELWVLN